MSDSTDSAGVPVALSAKPGTATGPPLPSMRPVTAPTHVHVLAKPTGPICNLDCEYCFFLSKEVLYPGDRFRMSDDLLEQYVRQVIEAQAGPHVTIAWGRFFGYARRPDGGAGPYVTIDRPQELMGRRTSRSSGSQRPRPRRLERIA